MALVKCDECGKEVSDRAPSCPNCGNPFLDPEEDVVTIQQTQKKWKRVKIYSWILIISGLLMLGAKESSEVVFWFGANVVVFGVIGLVVAKFGSWWSTG